jgi:ABC-type transport system substrate-binding protein
MKVRPTALVLATATTTLAVGVLAVGLATVPADAAPSGPTIPLFTIGGVGDVTTLDMTKTDANGDIDDLTLESLLKLGANGQIEPELATSWAQPNPVTYVYHLRQGVKFWDGTELTSADVVYSLNYERAPGSEAAIGFSSVKSIAADGPYAVVVTLSKPDASWQYTLGAYNARIFEMKFAEEHKARSATPGPWLWAAVPGRSTASTRPREPSSPPILTGGAGRSRSSMFPISSSPQRRVRRWPFAPARSTSPGSGAHRASLPPRVRN